MQVTIRNISEIQQEADLKISQEELQPHFEEAYEKFRPKVELKGFRKGKVPMPMIKQLYGAAIEQDALDEIASSFFRTAMEEKQIHPIGQPTMVDMDFKRGEHFNFTIKYEVKPGITLGKYKGLAVEKPVHIVTDAEVEAEITNILRANSTTAEAPSVTDAHFIVTGDVQELDEAGTPLIGKKTLNARFDLSDETLVGEIRSALAAAEPGQTYRAKYESRHDDHVHVVHLAITATKVEQVILPDFEDAFVQRITAGKVTSVTEFRKNLQGDMKRYWDEQAEGRVNDSIARTLVESHDFPVPDSLVESILDSFVEDMKNRSRDRKLPKGFDEKKFRDESRSYALFQAKWLLLKERIAEVEKLTVSSDEVEALAEREAAKIGVAKDRLLQYYRSSNGPSDRLLADKLMAFLRDNAKITEKLVQNEPQHS